MKENIKGMLHYTRQAFSVSLVLMLVCGLLFPLLLSGISAILFPHQAEGSLIEINGKAVAAERVKRVAQAFQIEPVKGVLQGR